MYIFDTDTLTLAHRGHQKIAERTQQVGEAQVATTIITAIEILRGRQEYLLKARDGEQLLHAQRLLDSSQLLLQAIQLIPVTDAAAAEFDRLRENKKIKKIGRADLLIASIALAHRATLVTRNLKHFRVIPGLKLENWAD